MQISDEARDFLKSVLEENNANGIRVVFAGVS
jgi:predicted secreted protein